MHIFILCRALPKLVPRNMDLKKLFGGLATNVWYGIEEDLYLEAGALGLTMVTMKYFVGVGINVSSSGCRVGRRFIVGLEVSYQLIVT